MDTEEAEGNSTDVVVMLANAAGNREVLVLDGAENEGTLAHVTHPPLSADTSTARLVWRPSAGL